MTLSTTASGAISFDLKGALGLAGAEISAFDPGSDRLYVTSSVGLQVVSLADPSAPALIATIDFTAPAYGYATTDVTSVAISNGVVAVALPASPKSAAGTVIFLDAATGTKLADAAVGALPDMVAFTPDGLKVLIANEGEYLDSNGGPGTAEGSVSIIDISGGFGAALPVTTAGFGAFDAVALRAEGVRVFAGQTAAADLEPEYIAVSPDGTKAMVTLQEANAVALLDIATGTFTDIVALGIKDFSSLLADFSDRDGPGGTFAVNLETGNPVFGLYMPDAIDSYVSGGSTYYVIANEGDDRNDFLTPDEVVRLNSTGYVLDPTVFPDAATLKLDSELGRLNVVNQTGLRGDTDGDGDIDRILTLGGRSFSILDGTGAIVFDSADIIERIAATVVPAAVFDDRSDNKGPEPEGIEIAEIGGRTYALVGLERSHMTLAFDVTDPAAVSYAGLAQRPGDLNPEGGLFIGAADSPIGRPLYVATNEASNNISVFEVRQAPAFTLQILHASDFEAGIEATQRARNFAAIVDVLEDEVANSITLSSGDNFIPGAFTAGGTDPSVRDEIAGFYEQYFGLAPGSLAGIRSGTTPFNAADIAILNAIGVQASVLGNHEFDLGPSALAGAFDFVASLPSLPAQPTLASITNIGALFPYLSANLEFAAEGTLSGLFSDALQDANAYATTAAELSTGAGIRAEATGRELAPWTTIQEGGETIGVLGLTTQVLASISAVGNATVQDPFGDGGVDNMAELAAIVQPLVDQMIASGINKIILLTHLQQFINEQALAPLLRGVDIIVGGGSNTLLADATDPLAPGDTADGIYPLFLTGTDGAAIAVVNTDGNYNYVGRLVLDFDSNGEIIPASVDPGVSGAYVTTDAGVDAVAGDGDGTLSQAERDVIFADGTRGGEVQQITDAIAAVIQAKDGNVVGFTDVFLEGRRNEVRSEETNLGSLTADANLAFAKAVDQSVVISLKNGGGIRAEIGAVVGQPVPEELPPQANPGAGKPEGGVSQLDIENSLRFNNTISLVTLSAQGVLNMIENGLRGANPGATPGAFPQVAGLEFSWDKDRPSLDRVVDLVVTNQQGEIVDVIADAGVLVGDPTRLFRISTLSFLAPADAAAIGGGDSIIVRGATVSDTAAGLVSGTLAVYSDFTALDRVNLAGAGTGFDQIGGEQAVLADYLRALHGTPEAAFDAPDTTRTLDERIQNLDFRGDTVNPDGTGAVLADIDDAVLVGSSADNAINAGNGDDAVFGVGGDDTVRGGTGGDLVSGGAGDDRVVGNGGNDALLGGEGADRLKGGAGDDVLTGGMGADTFVIGAGDGADIVTDFEAGLDRINLRAFGFAEFAAVQAAATDTADGLLVALAGGSVTVAGLTLAGFVADDVLI